MAATNASVVPPEIEPAKVDQVIESMETFYRTVTGQAPPAGVSGNAPIPVEKDPAQFVQEQLDRLLAMLEAMPGGSLGRAAGSATWAPLLSIWEDDREFNLQIDLPGVERKDVEVILSGNLLIVSGRRPPRRDEIRRLRVTERPMGTFLRQVVLPPLTRLSTPRAQLRDGVLEVRIGKEEAAQTHPQPITIQ